jgi:hypothetical protein
MSFGQIRHLMYFVSAHALHYIPSRIKVEVRAEVNRDLKYQITDQIDDTINDQVKISLALKSRFTSREVDEF